MTAEPFAVSIEEACKLVGVSRRIFYETYIHSGRVKLLPMGARRLVVVGELRDAFNAFVAETRAAQTDQAASSDLN